MVVASTYRLEVDGVPQAQARPRIGRHGFYNPKKAFKARVKPGVQGGPLFGPGQPIVVAIQFMMKRPLSHFKCGKRGSELKTRAPLAHTGRPDLDNLTKFVSDGMNELVWPDDCS